VSGYSDRLVVFLVPHSSVCPGVSKATIRVAGHMSDSSRQIHSPNFTPGCEVVLPFDAGSTRRIGPRSES